MYELFFFLQHHPVVYRIPHLVLLATVSLTPSATRCVPRRFQLLFAIAVTLTGRRKTRRSCQQFPSNHVKVNWKDLSFLHTRRSMLDPDRSRVAQMATLIGAEPKASTYDGVPGLCCFFLPCTSPQTWISITASSPHPISIAVKHHSVHPWPRE